MYDCRPRLMWREPVLTQYSCHQWLAFVASVNSVNWTLPLLCGICSRHERADSTEYLIGTAIPRSLSHISFVTPYIYYLFITPLGHIGGLSIGAKNSRGRPMDANAKQISPASLCHGRDDSRRSSRRTQASLCSGVVCARSRFMSDSMKTWEV